MKLPCRQCICLPSCMSHFLVEKHDSRSWYINYYGYHTFDTLSVSCNRLHRYQMDVRNAFTIYRLFFIKKKGYEFHMTKELKDNLYDSKKPKPWKPR